MSKRIVIVDDRPWKMQESIQNLQKEGIVFYKTIYYPNNTIPKEAQNELMEAYKESTKIEVVQVNTQSEFLDEMNKLYGIKDIIFLMDYDLKGDMSRDDFFTRINVKYALSKDQNEKKIWFYTTGPNDIKGLLRETFPDNVMSVPGYQVGALGWDVKQVKAVVEG